MDKNFLIIFPYWLLFASVIGAQIYIRKTKIIPTLKKYGKDYEDYWSIKKQNKQLREYIEICKQYNLPSIHWKYMRVANKIAFVLLIGWFCLAYLGISQEK